MVMIMKMSMAVKSQSSTVFFLLLLVSVVKAFTTTTGAALTRLKQRRQQRPLRRRSVAIESTTAKTAEDTSSTSVDFQCQFDGEILVTTPPALDHNNMKKRRRRNFLTIATRNSSLTNPRRTLPEFLKSPHGSAVLLGGGTTASGASTSSNQNVILREDGRYDCYQPPLMWFGFELQTILVNEVTWDSDSKTITINVVDARTEIVGNRKGKRAAFLSKIMDKCTFVAKSVLSYKDNHIANNERLQKEEEKEEDEDEGWILHFDFSFGLRIPLPRFLPVPLGFNRVGSMIVSTTCQSRVQENLIQIREAYRAWATASATS